MTNTRVSTFAVRSERKKTCFPTNTIYPSLHRVDSSLLQCITSLGSKKTSDEQSNKKLDSRTNQLKEGGNDTNRARGKSSKFKFQANNHTHHKQHEGNSSSRPYKSEFK